MNYHHEGELRHVYNFTTNNLNDGYAEIRRHLNEIYDDQNVTYRIHFAFGMILFNIIKTGSAQTTENKPVRIFLRTII